VDPGCFYRNLDPGSEFSIPDPNPLYGTDKELKYFNPKKLILSSRKYDPRCLSGIPDLDLGSWDKKNLVLGLATQVFSAA
jgi:hypothetical protein